MPTQGSVEYATAHRTEELSRDIKMNGSQTMHQPTAEGLRDIHLKRRYLRKDGQGHIIESETQMYRRVANVVAAVEDQYGALSVNTRKITPLATEQYL